MRTSGENGLISMYKWLDFSRTFELELFVGFIMEKSWLTEPPVKEINKYT